MLCTSRGLKEKLRQKAVVTFSSSVYFCPPLLSPERSAGLGLFSFPVLDRSSRRASDNPSPSS